MTVKDINRPRPQVLLCFQNGGAIPLNTALHNTPKILEYFGFRLPENKHEYHMTKAAASFKSLGTRLSSNGKICNDYAHSVVG